MYRAISVAGSNSRGGAGLQADLKTFQERDVFGMGVITAIVTLHGNGRRDLFPQSTASVAAQLDSAVDSMGVDALKTGMLYSSEVIRLVADRVRKYQLDRLVVDPVIVTKTGGNLLQEEALQAVKQELLPLAQVVTPNLPEAEKLTGRNVRTLEEMKEAARRIHEWGPAYVLVKGGRLQGEKALDVLYDGSAPVIVEAKRVETTHTNGAGCTLSAAITAELAKGKSVEEAVRIGKSFVTAAIAASWETKEGVGPVNHWAYRRRT